MNCENKKGDEGLYIGQLECIIGFRRVYVGLKGVYIWLYISEDVNYLKAAH